MERRLNLTATLTTTGTVTPPIGPVPPDTAAALWSAIDAYGCDAASHGALGRDATTRAAIDRAITAHVEAEVARRLTVAPDVKDAIQILINGMMLMDHAKEAKVRRRGLLAAIAADRARAVAATISPAVHELRNALPPVRHHAQRIEPGDRREAMLRGVDRALAVADELAAVLDGGPARVGPTPDEARRLVEALRLDLLATADTVAALHGAVGTGLRNHCVAVADKLRLTADTARAALLRALGAEA